MRKLPHWLESIEFFVDRAIPFVLVLLAVMIIAEFTHFAPEYEHYFHYLDLYFQNNLYLFPLLCLRIPITINHLLVKALLFQFVLYSLCFLQ